jgi:hypothetical protein
MDIFQESTLDPPPFKHGEGTGKLAHSQGHRNIDASFTAAGPSRGAAPQGAPDVEVDVRDTSDPEVSYILSLSLVQI